jgi:predicted SnoaL-like aldol condensation-catalyzing enzyme
VEANKELVRRFYDAFYEAAHTVNVDLIDPFVAADYIQHEQDVGPGREGLKALLRQMAGRPSAAPPPLLHLIAEGDIVAAHQIVPGADPNGPLRAEGVDIFRIANSELVEHWGVDVEYHTAAATPPMGTPAP